MPAGGAERPVAGETSSDTVVAFIEQNPLLFVAIIVIIVIAAAVLVKRQRLREARCGSCTGRRSEAVRWKAI